MPGLAEGLEGAKAGDKREIRVTFPDRMGAQGGDLEGQKAIFEVEVVSVKVCRCWWEGVGRRLWRRCVRVAPVPVARRWGYPCPQAVTLALAFYPNPRV